MRETNINQRVGESLDAYYRRIAKQADQRLVRLERLAQQSGYEGAAKWSYLRAQEDIARRWGGKSEKPRFNTKPPEDTALLKAKIRDIQDFLQAPTSTKSGINAVYKKRADTFNAENEFGIKVQWEDWAEFLDRFGGDLYEKYGSKVLNMVIKTVQSMADTDPDMSAQKLHHLALLRKDGGYQFNYVKKDGTDGGYYPAVDQAMHDIFRKRKDIEAMYSLLVSK